MKISLLFISILLSFGINQFALGQITPYSKVINDQTLEGIQAVASCQNYEGSTILAGYGFFNLGSIIAVDRDGILLWNQSWAVSQSNRFPEFRDIIPTHDSCFFVLGRYYHPDNNNLDAFYAKLDNNGDTIWTASNTMGNLNRCSETQDHGFILIGNHEVSGSQNSQITIAKIDLNGNLEWSKILKIGEYLSNGYSIKQKTNGNYIIAGYYQLEQHGTKRGILAELSPEGEIIWVQTYHDNIDDYNLEANDFIRLDDAFYTLLNYEHNSVIMKTDTIGNIIWSKDIQSAYHWDYMSYGPRKLRKTPNNDLLFIGINTFSTYTKLDSDGNVLLHGTMEINAQDVHSTENDGMLVTGNGPIMGVKKDLYSYNIGLIQMDEEGYGPLCTELSSSYATEKEIESSEGDFTIHSGGTESSVQMEIGSISLFQVDICVDFIGGTSDINSNYDISIYPNPSNGHFILESDNNIEGELRIFNFTGQLVYSNHFKGDNKQIDISEKPNGIYTYILSSKGHIIATERFIIQK